MKDTTLAYKRAACWFEFRFFYAFVQKYDTKSIMYHFPTTGLKRRIQITGIYGCVV